jgi:hypothetical protein
MRLLATFLSVTSMHSRGATMMARTKTLKAGATEKQVAEQVLQAASMLGIELKRRNVGGFTNARGQYVPCADKHDADYYAVLPDGRHLDLELKREGFDPARVRGEERERFDGQLARLRETNVRGGVGFFCDNSEVFIRVMQIVLRGGWVEQTEHDLIVYDPEIIEERP